MAALLHSHSDTPLLRHSVTPMHARRDSVTRSRRQAVTTSFLHMDCTVQYDGLLHRWIRRWTESPILDVETLLHRSHGHDSDLALVDCPFPLYTHRHSVTPSLCRSVTPTQYTHAITPSLCHSVTPSLLRITCVVTTNYNRLLPRYTCMDTTSYNHTWAAMVYRGLTGLLYTFVGHRGLQWVFVDGINAFGLPWIIVDYRGLPWVTSGDVCACALSWVTVDYRGLPGIRLCVTVCYRGLQWVTAVGYQRDINVFLQRWMWVSNIANVVWVTVDSGGNSVKRWSSGGYWQLSYSIFLISNIAAAAILNNR